MHQLKRSGPVSGSGAILVAAVVAALLATSCLGVGGTGTSSLPPGAVPGALTQGLIAYATDQAIGVLDPATGKTAAVSPLPTGGAFRISGPVWGPVPGLSYPVIYFTIHDDRPAEHRTTTGVVPYDWLFRVDPFAGTIEPLAASQDSVSEGPLGLVANAHYLALTLGCCSSYEVDALDLTQPFGPLKVLSRPPAQTAFFTEGVAPGASGLVAVREFGTGNWYWLNADAGVLNPFPLALGPDDGPIAISTDGSMVAVALPDKGALIEPISLAVPPAPSPSASASGSPAASASPKASPVTTRTPSPSPAAAPRHVNSKLPHPDGLAWSPDAKQLAVAVNGQLEVYQASGSDGTAPLNTFLGGGNVIGVSWSAPIAAKSLAMVKGDAGSQPMVDALLAATQLPAAADTPANRPLTKVFVWQFDSTKSSPIEAIADATASVLATYPPLPAGVVFHHWAPFATWGLLGGCFRYRTVVTGSAPPTPFTFGLAGNALCSQKPSPSAAGTHSPAASPGHSPSPS